MHIVVDCDCFDILFMIIIFVYFQYKEICKCEIGSKNDWHRTFLIFMDLVECKC